MENKKRITRAVRNAASFMFNSKYGPELTKLITAGEYDELRRLCHSINRKAGKGNRVLTKANIDAMINSQDELWEAIDMLGQAKAENE